MKRQPYHQGFPIPHLLLHLANVNGRGHSKDQKEEEKVSSEFGGSTHGCSVVLCKGKSSSSIVVGIKGISAVDSVTMVLLQYRMHEIEERTPTKKSHQRLLFQKIHDQIPSRKCPRKAE